MRPSLLLCCWGCWLHGKSIAVNDPATGKELWNLHVERLRLWVWLIARLWLITRLRTIAALVGLLRLLRVVPTLAGWYTCE